MKSIRVVSDGTPTGTKVFDAATGAKLSGVRRIQWGIGIENAGVAIVEFVCPEVEFTVEEVKDGRVSVIDVTELGDVWKKYQALKGVEKESA